MLIYQAFGMRIESEIELDLPATDPAEGAPPIATPAPAIPGSATSPGAGQAPAGSAAVGQYSPARSIRVRRTSIEPDPTLTRRLGNIRYGLKDGNLDFDVAWAARFKLRNDDDIDVDPAPGADPRMVAVYVSGLILPCLLRRYPIVLLHGSAVSRKRPADGPCALAFLGDRGSGKSTTAAALAGRCYRILCDDAVPIAAGPTVLPGLPRPKLMSDAYLRLVGDPASADAVLRFDSIDKYQALLPHSQEPARLRAIFVLEAVPGVELSVTPLRGAAKLAAAIGHVSILDGVDDVAAIFPRLAQMLDAVHVYRVVRPSDRDSLEAVTGAIARLDP